MHEQRYFLLQETLILIKNVAGLIAGWKCMLYRCFLKSSLEEKKTLSLNLFYLSSLKYLARQVGKRFSSLPPVPFVRSKKNLAL